MSTPTNPNLLRHLAAIACAPPATAAIAVACLVLYEFVDHGFSSRGTTLSLAPVMMLYGSLVGYVIELIVFAPLYALAHHFINVNGIATVLVGVAAGALPPLAIHMLEASGDPDSITGSFLQLTPWLSALGALGGLIYWLFVRETSTDPAPLSGLSESQP